MDGYICGVAELNHFDNLCERFPVPAYYMYITHELIKCSKETILKFLQQDDICRVSIYTHVIRAFNNGPSEKFVLDVLIERFMRENMCCDEIAEGIHEAFLSYNYHSIKFFVERFAYMIIAARNNIPLPNIADIDIARKITSKFSSEIFLQKFHLGIALFLLDYFNPHVVISGHIKEIKGSPGCAESILKKIQSQNVNAYKYYYEILRSKS